MKKIFLILISLIFILVLFIYVINKQVNKIGVNVCNLENVDKQVALVLGARVWNNGNLSDIFRDRVETAIGLYNTGKVEKILVSGDHGQKDYDEVGAAKDYLLEHGVKSEDVFLDHAGFDTYDSLYRTKEVFQVESLIIVTQAFHLPRALYIANKLGMDACGVSADLHSYTGEEARNIRETLAKVKAYLDVTFNSLPRYLGDKIPLSGSGVDTWD
jgi:SanA protein